MLFIQVGILEAAFKRRGQVTVIYEKVFPEGFKQESLSCQQVLGDVDKEVKDAR